LSWLRIGIAVVITVVWAVGYVLSYAGATQAPPTELTPLMLGVVGFLLTGEAKRKLTKAVKAMTDEDESTDEPT
jgi:hypothetical protein